MIVKALSADWEIEVLSWLPDIDRVGRRRLAHGPLALIRGLALSLALPAQVAYVQARVPRPARRRIAAREFDRVLFVTDRAVPRRVADGFAVDFIDDLGGAAFRRASSSLGAAALFWRWEAKRLRRFDRRVAEKADVAIACTAGDASAISPVVRVVPLAVGCEPLPEDGDKVVFIGNLFYAPNHEAAIWICDQLSPRLSTLGVEPSRIVIAGRRPQASLRERAAAVGVDLRADVDDLSDVLREAAIVLAPMTLGSGTQNKILDAVGANRPCVLSPVANASLALTDGESAFIRDRTADAFSDAVMVLLEDPFLRAKLAEHARAELAEYLPAAVEAAWRAALR